MRKALLIAGAALSLVVAGPAVAQNAPDFQDIDAVHTQVETSIEAMGKAKAAHHYDAQGHGARAEALLRQAAKELKASYAASKLDAIRNKYHAP